MKRTTVFFIVIGAALAAAAVAAVAFTSDLGNRSEKTSAPTTLSAAPRPPPNSGPETVEQFAIAFRVAIDAGDVAFLFERLHPVVSQVYGIPACERFIEAEVLRLADYAQTGPATGPTTRTFSTPNGTVSAETYAVPIAYIFHGEHFEDTALYGPLQGEMRWFAECR